MAINLTSQGTSLVVDNNGVKKVLPKGDITVKLNLPYLELSYNGTPEFQIQDHTLVTTPESESISDLFSQMPGLLDTTTEGAEGGDVTEAAIISALGYTPANAANISNRTNWDLAYGWGDHESGGYSKLDGGNTFTGTQVFPSTVSIGSVSATEISYLDGVNTSIQANIDSRAPNNLNGYTSGAGTVASTDTILQAIQKLNGNDGLKANLAGGNTFTGTQSFPSTVSIGNVSATEIGFLDGVTSSIQTQLDSKVAAANGTLTGTTTTGSLLPASNGTAEIGSSTLRYLNGFFGRINAAGTLTLISSGANPILFSTASPTSGVHAGFSDSKLILQTSATSLTASTGELIQVNGTAKITGNTAIGGNLTVSTIPAFGSKSSTILVDNGGIVSSRTTAQLYADINDVQNFKRVAGWEAQGNGSTVNSAGLAVTAEGTATARSVATTNFYTGMRRLGYVGATTTNSPAGIRGNNAQFQVARGFSFRAVFGIQAYDAGHRYYVGMGETADNTVEPSALVNRLNMYADPGDVTWKIRGANASQGTAIDLGANFPVNTSATDVYDVTFNCEPGATTATYLVRRLNTGDVASGTISTVPGSVLIRPQVIAGNAATGTAASIDISRVVVITEN